MSIHYIYYIPEQDRWRSDNTPAKFYFGAFCASCWNRKSPVNTHAHPLESEDEEDANAGDEEDEEADEEDEEEDEEDKEEDEEGEVLPPSGGELAQLVADEGEI